MMNSNSAHDTANRNTPPETGKSRLLTVPQALAQARREPYPYERWLMAKLLRMAGSPPIRFQLWNGDLIELEDVPARFTIHLRDHKALLRLLGNPNLAFGDLYSAGRIEVDGNLTDLMEALYRTADRAQHSRPKWLEALWRNQAPRSTDVTQARENIHHHYDLGNTFYRLWLDKAEMQYTCAYYESEDLTLEQAQLAKLEHVCRKLRLRPGMVVAEAGCGWGGLSRYMARHYGVRVRAYNISREQLAYAREEADRQGLDHLIEYVEDDYRNIEGEYDAFVSIGMLEHVGKEHFPAMSSLIKRVLKPEGLALLHSIGRNQAMRLNAWIEKRIFPGAYPPSISEFMDICEAGNFSVLDVENLRLHYAQTLAHWMDRFQAHRQEVVKLYDANFVRAWELYLAGSTAAFRAGSLQLFQVLFTHGDNNGLPNTRQDLYRKSAVPEDGSS